jgi:HAMP domain-containing protein
MTTPIVYMDRDELLALQRAEAVDSESTDNEHELNALLDELRIAEAELAASEQSFRRMKQSIS